MRTLSATLSAAQQANSLEPRPRITLSDPASVEADVVLEYPRISSIPAYDEGADSYTLQVVCDNADKYFVSLSLHGWDAKVEWGLVTAAGVEYSECAPQVVIAMTLSSDPSALLCYLTMAGIPDMLAQDEASADYSLEATNPKYVKDLIEEIADGQPSTSPGTTETVDFPTSDPSVDLIKFDRQGVEFGSATYDVVAVGQRLSIPNRLVTHFAFWLNKTLVPTGTLTFKIEDVETGAELASETFALTDVGYTADWCEVELSSAVQLDKEIVFTGATAVGGVYMYATYTGGTAAHYISAGYKDYGVKANEWLMIGDAVLGMVEISDMDCKMRYTYTADGIEVYDHCVSYDTVFDPSGAHTGANGAATLTDSGASFKTDQLIGQVIFNTTDGSSGTITDNDATTITATLSGGTDDDWDTDDVYSVRDALMDTYQPEDSFKIFEGDTRLTKINQLLGYTTSVKRFENDGKMHIFKPVTAGSVYDEEYSLADADFKFFSKSARESLVLPNKVTIHSYSVDTTAYTGSATSAASYALRPKDKFIKAKLISNAQAATMAAAYISQLEIASQRGSCRAPLNLAAELYDYNLFTDARQGDSRTGNLGVIHRSYNPSEPTYGWQMSLRLGSALKYSFSPSKPSDFNQLMAEGDSNQSEFVTYGALRNIWNLELEPLIWDGDTMDRWSSGGETIGISDLYVWIKSIVSQLSAYGISLNHVRDDLSVSDQIDTALVEYNNANPIPDGVSVVSPTISILDGTTTPTRALSTVYTNSGDTAILCVVHIQCAHNGGLSGAYAYVDTNATPTTVVGIFSPGSTMIINGPLVFVVPPGKKYRVVPFTSGSSTVSLLSKGNGGWAECTVTLA